MIQRNIKMISSSSETAEDTESEDWYALSLQGLNRAYGDEEPEYELSQIKEFNPSYEMRQPDLKGGSVNP
jgi:hypothetical protein